MSNRHESVTQNFDSTKPLRAVAHYVNLPSTKSMWFSATIIWTWFPFTFFKSESNDVEKALRDLDAHSILLSAFNFFLFYFQL